MGDLLGVRGFNYLLLLCCMTFSISLYQKMTQIFPFFFYLRPNVLRKFKTLLVPKKGSKFHDFSWNEEFDRFSQKNGTKKVFLYS